MHHHPLNQERALNLSILTVSGPGEFSRVELNLSLEYLKHRKIAEMFIFFFHYKLCYFYADLI